MVYKVFYCITRIPSVERGIYPISAVCNALFSRR